MKSPIQFFENPLTEVYHGNCNEVLQENLQQWAGAFDLAFIDPPFNIGRDYDEHDDNMPRDEFELMITTSMALHTVCLRDGGVFVVHVPDSMVELVLNCARTLPLKGIDWIIWHYRFGVCQRTKFISSKCHGLVFSKRDAQSTKSTQHTWNPDSILVDSDRATIYNDPRIDDTVNGGQRVPFDVWCEFPRLQGNNKERSQFSEYGSEPHDNQLPELYLARYIQAFTNEGDNVIDGYGGTGTTATVCRALKRNCVTIEKSAQYVSDIINRVSRGAIRL